MSEPIRWTNPSQPQTLVFATFLSYIGAVFLVINTLLGAGDISLLSLALIVGPPLATVLGVAGLVGAGWGIANEKKWGYFLGIAMSAIDILSYAIVIFAQGLGFGLLIGVIFAGMHAVLLLHPESRAYVKIWFK